MWFKWHTVGAQLVVFIINIIGITEAFPAILNFWLLFTLGRNSVCVCVGVCVYMCVCVYVCVCMNFHQFSHLSSTNNVHEFRLTSEVMLWNILITVSPIPQHDFCWVKRRKVILHRWVATKFSVLCEVFFVYFLSSISHHFSVVLLFPLYRIKEHRYS